MDTFIRWHTLIGFVLIVLGVITTIIPKTHRSRFQSFIAQLFFIMLIITGISGIVIGVYRHPASVSIFQVVTVVGVIFGMVGLLAEMGKLENFRRKSNVYWYINGLGGSLIATTSASLFFIALTYFRNFYQSNIIWLSIIFIGLPVVVGREFIKKNIEQKFQAQNVLKLQLSKTPKPS